MQDTLNLQHKSPERWKWYQGYEGIYQVSTWGQVRSVDRWVTYPDGRRHFRKGRILKPARTKDGYLRVGLSRDGKLRNFLVHRMVAETFIPNPEKKPQVNHRDENKENNSVEVEVENLEWVSAKENVNWGSRNKRAADSRLNGSLSKPVQAINPSTGEVILEFPSIKEAGRKGFKRAHINACCRGERRRHRGFEWRFKES